MTTDFGTDFPTHRVLIATTRDMGGCPCPRCIVPKDQIRNLGTASDKNMREGGKRRFTDEIREKIAQARKYIYKDGYAVNSEKVEKLLKPESLVPTNNAFSERLSEFIFQVYELLVVDQMHEFELGVWKALLTHLIRILNSLGNRKAQEFNARLVICADYTVPYLFLDRFRLVPPFGRSTIRRITRNVSEMKQLAARDFEDILQVMSV